MLQPLPSNKKTLGLFSFLDTEVSHGSHVWKFEIIDHKKMHRRNKKISSFWWKYNEASKHFSEQEININWKQILFMIKMTIFGLTLVLSYPWWYVHVKRSLWPPSPGLYIWVVRMHNEKKKTSYESRNTNFKKYFLKGLRFENRNLERLKPLISKFDETFHP